jgi:nucleoside-diphosphate-sugar epimerase
LLPIEDVYSNHIHADDLARITVKALFHASSARIYHASDDSSLLMGDYFDLVAEKFHLPKAPRLPRCELIKQINPMLLSFMSESRRMRNDRIKAELGVRLLYPSVREGLAAIE